MEHRPKDRTEQLVNYIVAYAMYGLGIRPKVSTGICGFLTYGYGRLDDYGYWEYPLLKRMHCIKEEET